MPDLYEYLPGANPSARAPSSTYKLMPDGTYASVMVALNDDGSRLNEPGTSTSTPLTGAVSDTADHVLGPFTPQLGREIWLTINALASTTGVIQLLRSTDGGTTKLGITAGGVPIGIYRPVGIIGVLVNEVITAETDATATYYLAVTLTGGSITARIAQ